MMDSFSVVLWAVVPYLAIVVFVLGHVWRYRYDKFGWTTRSSELYEKRLLRLGSPLFHFGILVVLIGHVIGILVPRQVTAALGISDGTYHLTAAVLGGLAGLATVLGLAILIWRRRTVGPVFSATTRNDKVMYVILGLVLVSGLAATAVGSRFGGSPAFDYRETVAVWFRSIFALRPDFDAVLAAPPLFQLHLLAAWILFGFWPFTRLVHVLSAPVGYLFRPALVYRSRRPGTPLRRPARGWR